MAQDVFEKAQRAIGTFRGDSRVLTWLYRVATNAAIDRLRSAERRADLEGSDGAADPADADGAPEAAEERSLDRELDRTRMRECILQVVEQLLSLGAAKIRLHRARRALKAALERACDFERDEENEFGCAPKPGSLVSLGRSR